MALLTATRPTAVGVLWSPTTVSASDTISGNDLGTAGAYLVCINGAASPNTVTISDSSLTQAGNAATTAGNTVTNATTEVMYISPKAVNPSTNLVTVTNSNPIANVTCVLLPIG
jgi:hypothetical protein